MNKKSNSYKETFSFTIINYIGIVIGIFATLFLFPNNKEAIGVVRFVEGIAYILYPIFVFGTSQALINFNPKVNAQSKQKLFIYSFYTIFFISLFFLVIFSVASFLGLFNNSKIIFYSFAIAFCMAILELFKKKATIANRITIPTLFDTLVPKIALATLFYFLLIHQLDLNQLLSFYVSVFVFVLLSVGLYLKKYFQKLFIKDFKSLFAEVSKKEYFNFSLYAFAGSLGTIFALRMDSIMIPLFLSMEDNGNFSIAVSLVSALAVPANGIFALYSPIISKYFSTQNMVELNIKYKEISIFLFFIGVLIYSCLFLGIENLFLLLPTGKILMNAVPIILILGLTILINMGTGFNSEIITYSNHYRFNLIAILVLVSLNFVLNIVFLYFLKLGVIAVALSSLISMLVFNVLKLVFIYRKFKLFPFDLKYLGLFITSTSVLAFVYFIPETISIFFNLVAKVVLCILLNLVLIYRLNFVIQFNFILDNFFRKIFKRKQS